MMKILIVGSGGREHALAWKLAQSPRVSRIYAAPGNAGIAEIAECVPIAATDIHELLSFAMTNNIDLTVVGPEIPLIAGIVDVFEQQGQRIFGPAREPAMLEGSKSYSKALMQQFNIPTAEYKSFDNAAGASHFANELLAKSAGRSVVIKADGEAAGKGVIICENVTEIDDALNLIMVERAFGDAGNSVIVEEFLVGQEASLMAFTDGITIVPMVAAQDHKRAFDGDMGPNTGGMGCYAPVKGLTQALYTEAVDRIIRPAVEAIRGTGIPYKGVIYAGIMICEDGSLKTLEFNCRFGDPEAQTVLPLLDCDLLDILIGVTDAHLDAVNVRWKAQTSVSVALASGGYPGAYETGKVIHGLRQVAHLSDVYVFHAGTKLVESGDVVTNGGRVLNVTGLGDDILQARARAYAAIKNLAFYGARYRSDIGYRAIETSDSSTL